MLNTSLRPLTEPSRIRKWPEFAREPQGTEWCLRSRIHETQNSIFNVISAKEINLEQTLRRDFVMLVDWVNFLAARDGRFLTPDFLRITSTAKRNAHWKALPVPAL